VALLLGEQDFSTRPDLFIATIGRAERAFAFGLMHGLLRLGIKVELDYEGKSLKSQLRRADKLNARYSVVIGETELAAGRGAFKFMDDGTQIDVPLLSEEIRKMLG